MQPITELNAAAALNTKKRSRDGISQEEEHNNGIRFEIIYNDNNPDRLLKLLQLKVYLQHNYLKCLENIY